MAHIKAARPHPSNRLRLDQLEERVTPVFGGGGTEITSALNNSGHVLAADFNGDGLSDFVAAEYGQGVTNPSGGLTVFINDLSSPGTFPSTNSLNPSGTGTSFVQVADMNGDNKLDIVATNANSSGQGTIDVFLGDGTGGFATPLTFDAGGKQTSGVTIADFNGDGDLDAAVSNIGATTGGFPDGNNVTILLGNGTGNLTANKSYSPSNTFLPTSIVADDFNGDGSPDLAVTTPGVTGYGQTNGVVQLFTGNGDGSFNAGLSIDSGAFLPITVTLGDFNNDCKHDLLISNSGGTASPPFNGKIKILLGTGTGGFQSGPTLMSNTLAFASLAGYFDADGNQDIVGLNLGDHGTGSNGEIHVFTGNGTGQSFVAVTGSPFDAQQIGPQSFTAADFNGDGTSDIVVVGLSGKAVMFLNQTTVNAAPQITSTAPPNGAVGVSYTHTLTASGDPTPSICAHDLPPGLTFNSTTGEISGTPTTVGTYQVTVVAANGGGIDEEVYEIVIGEPDSIPQITTTALDDGVMGQAYNFTVEATGNPDPTFSETSNVLTGIGLSISSAGVISGTPNSFGDFQVTITASNAQGSDTETFALHIEDPAPHITTTSLNDGVMGQGYSFTVQATGIPAPTFTQTGLEAVGLTMNSSGVITGTPTSAGDFQVQVTASNSEGTDNKTFTLTIGTLPEITTVALDPGVLNQSYSETVQATGSTPLTFTASGLPNGLTINSSSGLISGVPQAGGSFDVTITVQNEYGQTSRPFELVIGAVPVITTPALPSGSMNNPYSTTIVATGLPTPTFSATGLPTGLSISSTGVLSGTPTVSGVFDNVQITASNIHGSHSETYTLTIGAAPQITSSEPPDGALGLTYQFQVVATGTPSATLSASGLPPGLTMDNTGLISGTPTAVGNFNGVITATNGIDPNAQQPFSISITGELVPPTITNGPPPSQLTVGEAFSFVYTVDGTAPITFTATGLPTGLEISADGVISGTPTEPGSFEATITASNGANTDATQTAIFTVSGPGQPPPAPGGVTTVLAVSGPANQQVYSYRFGQDGRTSETTLSATFANLGVVVRVAAADVNGDGIEDSIVGTGPGTPTQVRVLDGAGQAPTQNLQAFEPSFLGGVFVAAGDINGDGFADIVIAPDQGGGPRTRIYDGRTGEQIADFFGIEDPDFRGGARPAFGDINGDGFDDLIVAAGFLGGPRIAVWDGRSIAEGRPEKIFPDFFAFEQTLRDGSFVAAGNLNGDDKDDLVFGGGPGGAPRVFALDGAMSAIDVETAKLQPIANFFAFPISQRGGVHVAVKDMNGDEFMDLVAGSGENAPTGIATYLGSELMRNGNSGPSPHEIFDPFNLEELELGVYVG